MAYNELPHLNVHCLPYGLRNLIDIALFQFCSVDVVYSLFFFFFLNITEPLDNLTQQGPLF